MINQDTAPETAVEFLTKAGNLLIERAAQYDQPGGERSMGKTVDAFNTITGRTLSEAEGWFFMMMLKQVRFFQNAKCPHRDSIEDLIAYSSLFAEATMKVEND